ncbi:branched-chain amino acid ABC transporter permease [Paracoccus sp. IB05]|uniref:branched-chain amino acid ABC transporter permease n=1 Tax=Paracoccus sp. IB05 TaxID=2779367 RepID=UPI0018E80AFD|nr:branched-chain amino acid ABC transporter permease [Paracoccus sp. IB05]MBJ2149315.1 branched-chain amino acid ABC transporter permease [Paracoccus sp. IB05]
MDKSDIIARPNRLVWGGLLALALVAPALVGFDLYMIHVGITISFNVALATSLWMIWSLGVISFAHAGFMGIGAYASALVLTKLGLSMWYGLWIGAAVSALFAMLIAVPLMRTRAVYFFMASWAVGEVIKRNFAYFKDFFGGWDGVFDIKPPVLDLGFLQIDFANRIAYYYLALFFVSLTVWIIYRMNASRTGTIWWAIHENELLAQHTGINVFRQKVVCFTIACTLVGVIGALYAHYQTYISPKSFDIWKSEFALVHLIVGGLTTVGGPVAGAISLTMVDEALRATGYFRTIFFGVVLIASVLLLPGGLETVPARIRKLFNRNSQK